VCPPTLKYWLRHCYYCYYYQQYYYYYYNCETLTTLVVDVVSVWWTDTSTTTTLRPWCVTHCWSITSTSEWNFRHYNSYQKYSGDFPLNNRINRLKLICCWPCNRHYQPTEFRQDHVFITTIEDNSVCLRPKRASDFFDTPCINSFIHLLYLLTYLLTYVLTYLLLTLCRSVYHTLARLLKQNW